MVGLKEHNKYDIAKWVSRVIQSCTTQDQVNSVDNLINNFDYMYDDYRLTYDLGHEASMKVIGLTKNNMDKANELMVDSVLLSSSDKKKTASSLLKCMNLEDIPSLKKTLTDIVNKEK